MRLAGNTKPEEKLEENRRRGLCFPVDWRFGLGTVSKYLKFFSFSLRRKGGRGLRPAGNTKPEEKLEENGWRGVGDG